MKLWLPLWLLLTSPVAMADEVFINNWSCNFVMRQYVTPPEHATSLWDVVEPFTKRNLLAILKMEGIQGLTSFQVDGVVRQALSYCEEGEEKFWFEALRHAVLGDKWQPLGTLPDPLPNGMRAEYRSAQQEYEDYARKHANELHEPRIIPRPRENAIPPPGCQTAARVGEPSRPIPCRK